MSPNSNGWSSVGVTNETTGATVPTGRMTSAEADRPVESVTFRVGR